jgi:hypothetical protein
MKSYNEVSSGDNVEICTVLDSGNEYKYIFSICILCVCIFWVLHPNFVFLIFH